MSRTFKQWQRRLGRSLPLYLWLGLALGAGAQVPTYVATVIDSNFSPTAINAKGQMAGNIFVPDAGGTYYEHAALYSGGVITDLGVLPGGTTSQAAGINASGQIVGNSDLTGGLTHAFLYTGGTMTDLGTLPRGGESYATAINDAGQITGWSSTTPAGYNYPIPDHAFLYSGGLMTDLGNISASRQFVNFSHGMAINASGQVAGWSIDDNQETHAMIYSGGQMTDLGTLGGIESRAHGINDSGEVVGWSYTNTSDLSPTHAFIVAGHGMQDLGVLAGSNASDAMAINNAGQVIGNTGQSGGIAFFYTAASGMVELDKHVSGSGWSLAGTESAIAINNGGQIVSYGGNDSLFDTYFLLTPPMAPVIGTPPASQTVGYGGSVTFKVTATGTAPLRYQWRKGTANISGATGTSLTLTNVSDTQAGSYSVVVTNGVGSAASDPAVLTVNALVIGGPLFVVNETDGVVNIPLVRTGGTTGSVSVSFSTSSTGATAKAGVDYTAISNQLVTLGDGVATLNVPVTILNPGGAAKPNVIFSVTLSSPTGIGLGAQKTATVLILNAMDSTPPSVPVISAPLSLAKVNLAVGDTLDVTGTAADNQRVASVEVSLNGGTFIPATVTLTGAGAAEGTTATFTATVTPLGGVNTLVAKTTDVHGNVSAVSATRSFTVLRPLVVNVDPALGTVTTGFAGSSFRQIGTIYTLTATPKVAAAPGRVFAGWTVNSTTGTGITAATQVLPTLTFTFQEGLELTATFETNPFVTGVIGIFNGLIQPDPALPAPNGTPPGNSTVGLLQNVVVTSTGAFTGTLKLDGLSLALAGKFDVNGLARFGTANATGFTYARTGQPTLALALQLDLSGASGQITGSVAQTTGSTLVARSTIAADRAYYNSTTSKVPSSLAGSVSLPYTLVFPAKAQTPVLDSSTYPQGYGCATMSVNVNGTVSLSGTLADNTAITASAPLSKANQWPLFAQLYALKGCIAGQAALTDADASTADVTATNLFWCRPVQNVQWYKNGWPGGIAVDASGARYAVPPATPAKSVFPNLQAISPNAALQFTGGLLTAPVGSNMTISTANLAVNVPAAASPTLVITKASGLISGSFTHTDLTKPVYQGVIIQKGAQQGGKGFFMSRATPLTYLGQGGAVSLSAK